MDVRPPSQVGAGDKALRILWLTPYVPLPTFGGGNRVFNLMRNLAPVWTIDVIASSNKSDITAGPLEAFCRHVELVPAIERSGWQRRRWQLRAALSTHSLLYWLNREPGVRNRILRMLEHNQYDVVVLEHAFMGYYHLPPALPVVLDQHNVESTLMLGASRHERTLLRRLYNMIEYRKFLPDEQRICRAASLIVTTSLPDRRLIERWGGSPPVTVVPNGVDSDYFMPEAFAHVPVVGARVLFTGSMHYAPNAEAMQFFCASIWPRILARVPDAQLQIVGGNPPPSIQRLAQLRNVEVLGYVEDLRPYIAQAAVAIAPIRIGSGTRLKILEAMAMGRAVVSTSLGAEGLEVISGQHLLVADAPEAFAEAVVTLLNDPTRRAALGLAARQLVKERYDWAVIARELDRALRTLVNIL